MIKINLLPSETLKKQSQSDIIILGGAVGGATGAAITTDGSKNEKSYSKQPVSNNNQGSFCPPGQAKKGRC